VYALLVKVYEYFLVNIFVYKKIKNSFDERRVYSLLKWSSGLDEIRGKTLQ